MAVLHIVLSALSRTKLLVFGARAPGILAGIAKIIRELKTRPVDIPAITRAENKMPEPTMPTIAVMNVVLPLIVVSGMPPEPGPDTKRVEPGG